jgi:hypothetical protein
MTKGIKNDGDCRTEFMFKCHFVAGTACRTEEVIMQGVLRQENKQLKQAFDGR